MMKKIKKITSVLLVVIMLIVVIPYTESQSKASAAAAGLSLSQLRQKFPNGKYWNHAGNPGSSNSVNNQDGYTSTPCSKHGVVGTSEQTCNGFAPSGTQLSWQCMGYAEKLGYDATGYNPRNNANGWYTYTSSSALDNLKPGDIVRYNNGGHSIYVIGVNGDTVTYTDCNSDGHCVIRWDATISKSTLRSSFTHVRSAPFAMNPDYTCNCSSSYAGTYTCTTSSSPLTIRSGHGSSYSAIGSIPSGATVTVTKASGTSSSDWAHVTYNGVSGYASMQYLSKKASRATYVRGWLSDPNGNEKTTFYLGEAVRLSYEIYDKNTGDLYNSYSNDSYTATLTLYKPDGSVAFSSTAKNADTYWIQHGLGGGDYGACSWKVVIKWSDGSSDTTVSGDFTVGCNSSSFSLTASKSSMNLSLGNKPSDTITYTISGTWPDNSKFEFEYDKNIIKVEGSGQTYTVTALKSGTTDLKMIVFVSKDSTKTTIRTLSTHIVVTDDRTYVLSYNANGGTGAPASESGSNTYRISTTRPTRIGYTLLGWSTSSSASSPSYYPSTSVSRVTNIITISKNTTLYAVWAPATTAFSSSSTLSVTPSYGGQLNCYKFVPASSGKYTIVGTVPGTNYKNTLTLYSSSGTELASGASSDSNTATAISYNLVSGNTYYFTTTRSGTNANPTDTYTLTLRKETYTLSYNANGGTGAPSSQTGANSYTISSTVPTYFPKTFLGWSTSSSATSAIYKPGDTINLTANTTLYAVWKTAAAISTGSSTSTTVGFANQEWYYKFTPSSSGTYVFESTGSLDTKVFVYNSSNTLLGSNDDDGSGNNFKLETELTSGTVYYVCVRAYSGYTGSTKFTITQKIMRGDLNGDGCVDAGDAVLISRYDAGLITLTTAQLAVGDLNNDGYVDAGDAVIISRYDAGLYLIN